MKTVKYFDNASNTLTEEDISTMVEFCKVHLNEKGEFKIVEFIENDKVVAVEYYLENTEAIEDYNYNFSNYEYITFYINKEQSGKFSKYDVLTLNNKKEIIMKRTQVYGDLILPIYDHAIDLDTNEINYLSKVIYNLENNIDFEFAYDLKTGKLENITVLDPTNFFDTDDRTIYPNEVGKNIYNFSWEGFEYYQNANPILPTTEIKALTF